MAASSAPRTRVLVVDDHRVVATGLALALGADPALEVIGVTDSVAGAAAVAGDRRPDVIVCDFHLADGTGADVARRVREPAPGPRVLVLSADMDDAAVRAAVEAGVAGYLEKTVDEQRLVEAVHRVAAGETLIPTATLVRLVAGRDAGRHQEMERERMVRALTPREREVLALLAEGLDSKTLARRLGISLSTARWHVQQVIEKLGTHSKLEAVARAAALGLVERGSPPSAGGAAPTPAR